MRTLGCSIKIFRKLLRCRVSLSSSTVHRQIRIENLRQIVRAIRRRRTSIEPQWDIHQLSIRRTSDVNWTSVGHLSDICWTSFGCPSSNRMGRPLDVPLIDVPWTSVGCPSDIHQMSVGQTLDVGRRSDARHTSNRPLSNVCRTFVRHQADQKGTQT